MFETEDSDRDQSNLEQGTRVVLVALAAFVAKKLVTAAIDSVQEHRHQNSVDIAE